MIVRIHTDEGISGVGEVGLAYGAGDLAGMSMVHAMADRFLISADPSRIEALWNQMMT
ncbi:MAG: hypothetical protein P1S60_14720 [Anaerolineae bacterium]|nr:hypothetical protein [Anaerolineae bacterium]